MISFIYSRIRYRPTPTSSPSITEGDLRAAVAAAVAAAEASRPSVEEIVRVAVAAAEASRSSIEEVVRAVIAAAEASRSSVEEIVRVTIAAVEASHSSTEKIVRAAKDAAVATTKATRSEIEETAVLRARVEWLEDLLANVKKKKKLVEAAIAEERRIGLRALAVTNERHEKRRIEMSSRKTFGNYGKALSFQLYQLLHFRPSYG